MSRDIETDRPVELFEEYNHGGFLIRYHRSRGNSLIVCINPRDGHLLQVDGAISIQQKLKILITEEDLLKIYGRPYFRPVRTDQCVVGYHEQVIALRTLDQDHVPNMKRFAEELIDRYEQGGLDEI